MRHDKDRPRWDRMDGSSGVADMSDEEFWGICEERAKADAEFRKKRDGQHGNLRIPSRHTD